ncbi:hypothetical protein M271_49330 [Streptomyces rapamycinicus NRRL 5491]|nr:hypothetical protein M271_49330 [Streptomyces rapamycinicus NRRL 5491]
MESALPGDGEAGGHRGLAGDFAAELAMHAASSGQAPEAVALDLLKSQELCQGTAAAGQATKVPGGGRLGCCHDR